jgi:5-formyltetrahydrofolate cyclo-ligase
VDAKSRLRERVWSLLDAEGAVDPPDAAGHIPSFVGAAAAACRLAELPAWHAARVIKANPDRAQLPVRVAALAAGKLVYMAVPRLETPEPFYVLDPVRIGPGADLGYAGTGAGAAELAPRVRLDEMTAVDLVVCGSVAVDRQGGRLGKGAGYSDIEVALLIDAGLIGPETSIVTTVHDLQVVDEPLPVASHDFRLHYVVTPTQVIQCPRGDLPGGIDRSRLTARQIAAIPALRTS